MTATPYRRVDFTDTAKDAWEVISTDDLNQVVSNLQYIREHSPAIIRRSFGSPTINTETKVQIACGKVEIPANKKSDNAAKNVRFPTDTFGSGSYIHLSLGIEGGHWPDYHKLHAVAQGLNGTSYPDYRGFRVFVNNHTLDKKNDKMVRMIRVHWLAVGLAPTKFYPAEPAHPILNMPTDLDISNTRTGTSRVIQ